MYQSSASLYDLHSSIYQPKYSSITSSSTETIPSLQPSSLLSQGEFHASDLARFQNPSSVHNYFYGDQLSPDENLVLQKAKEEENQYQQEIPMTTLINSRYNILKDVST